LHRKLLGLPSLPDFHRKLLDSLKGHTQVKSGSGVVLRSKDGLDCSRRQVAPGLDQNRIKPAFI
jgi:hypothetical protein